MKKVVVTGASGFVAGWVIVEFLKNGYAVKGSLRSMKKAEAIYNNIEKYVSKSELDNLSFFEADLSSKAGWVEAISDTDGVIHVASPMGHGTESVEELTSVAKNGVLNVLSSAKEAGVNRVVMTSSQAVSTPKNSVGDVTLDESFWTDVNNPELDPYRISKVRSEEAAWDFAKENNLELTTILPGAIFGPIMSEQTMSSNGILRQILKGLPAIPQVPMEISDVRDLANLHRLAFESDKAISQRYLAASQSLTMLQIAQIYKNKFPNLSITTRVAPNSLVRITSKFVPGLRALVPMLDRKYHHSTELAETDLGWKQHKPAQTVIDSAQSMIDLNLL
ncbi:NAD-dependent epimerase/dehydratase family protein [Companilactobacillus jidongensis]|uniref:NAD-dependent epimerase/dehydratase family protein n=1 Tax=Companilactobacillus jidongensis TaxID=2486006 RepID=UPI000F7AEDA9|nr:NAD-dependent epimerase/dehydratase family protein [Companilactobacillus jidongensis]